MAIFIAVITVVVAFIGYKVYKHLEKKGFFDKGELIQPFNYVGGENEEEEE